MVVFNVETLRDVLDQSLEFEDGEVGLRGCLELACEELVAQACEQYEIDEGFKAPRKDTARVAAAAPDMLVALKQVQPLLLAFNDGPWVTAAEVVKNAIAKATERQFKEPAKTIEEWKGSNEKT